MHWYSSDRSTEPHSIRVHVSEMQDQLQQPEVRRTRKTWLEKDECGDVIQYFSYSERTGTMLLSAKIGRKRVLISTECSLRRSPMLCFQDELAGDDAGSQAAHVLAHLR